MHQRRLTVLYGSQTGTAQDLAEDIWRESKRFYFKGSVSSMENYPIQNLIKEDVVIFVCSTTGQGDEPDNMKTFWKFLLRKSLPPDSLSSVKFAVLGLGDSSYVKFNFVAKKLNKRLLQLGGVCLLPLGLADDQHDLGASAVFLPWIAQLWDKLLETNPLPENLQPLPVTPRPYRWNVSILNPSELESVDLENDNSDLFHRNSTNAYEKSFKVTVKRNKRTTAPDHFQDVRLISFTSPPHTHNLGDVLYVRPQNSPERVAELFELFEECNLDLKPNTVVRVTEIDDELPVPCHLRDPLPLETVSRRVWDLSAVPRARALRLLSRDCRDELEKEKLLELSTAAGQQDLYSYVNRPRRSVLEVLRDFPHASAAITLQSLFEIFETIKPRAFSIASAPPHVSSNSTPLVTSREPAGDVTETTTSTDITSSTYRTFNENIDDTLIKILAKDVDNNNKTEDNEISDSVTSSNKMAATDKMNAELSKMQKTQICVDEVDDATRIVVNATDKSDDNSSHEGKIDLDVTNDVNLATTKDFSSTTNANVLGTMTYSNKYDGCETNNELTVKNDKFSMTKTLENDLESSTTDISKDKVVCGSGSDDSKVTQNLDIDKDIDMDGEENDLEILVAVVEYRTILKRPRLGLCSNWLAGLRRGDVVHAWFRRGTMVFPEKSDAPLIMVGPGTGLAPFRGVLLWKERQLDEEMSENSNANILSSDIIDGHGKKITEKAKNVEKLVGKNLLFFGCRGETKDFHCREDLERMERKGIVRLFCAFSRDQDDKIYVQHKIAEQKDLIREMISPKINKVADDNNCQISETRIYVAGNSKNMPEAVREAFSLVGGDAIESLSKAGMYQEETWS